MKLTKLQNRAKDKLCDEWKNCKELGETLQTMDALVHFGIAQKKREKLCAAYYKRA